MTKTKDIEKQIKLRLIEYIKNRPDVIEEFIQFINWENKKTIYKLYKIFDKFFDK